MCMILDPDACVYYAYMHNMYDIFMMRLKFVIMDQRMDTQILGVGSTEIGCHSMSFHLR